jgi:hypothetical protein
MGGLKIGFSTRIIAILIALECKKSGDISICQGCKAPERQDLDR